ncbi:MAG: ATP-binding protein [Elusimicrobiota bacterium]|jgi:predicted AAA+ superfamily ATPase|nr:ATP-binding protein [Elusimicrobiota bacterium]
MPNLQRTLSPAVKKASQAFKVLLLTGQRQVGKSTLFENLAGKERKSVSLDNLALRKLAKEDPELFLQQNPPPIIIDEVQYAPELFPYIKIYVDKHREEKGAFWLTGSQKFRLMQGVQESLAGRVAIFNLMGLSYKEKHILALESKPFLPSLKYDNKIPKQTINDVYKNIWEGSLPELIVNNNIDREKYYSSYIQTYIERDVKDFYNVEKPIQFFNFISVVAAQTGNLLNYASLARDVGIDNKTAQTWMGILERSGLVYLLHPYSPNVTKRIIKTPKMYFLDTGLASYLTRWTSPETLTNGAMAGHIFETYAVGEILKSYLHNGKEPLIYFYRDANQNEVDILLEENGTIYPIEIKKTANPGLNDCKGFEQIKKLNKKIGLGAVVCFQSERIPLSRDIISIPVWEI